MRLLQGLITVLLLLSFVLSCAPRKVPLERPPDAIWNDFRSGLAEYGPDVYFLINASISYITPDQRSRVQSRLWGRTGYPIRMDLSAGFGQTIAMWHEDQDLWQAYFPGQNIKYVHHEGSAGASILGFPTPLNLQQTSMVLLGAFGDLIPDYFSQVRSHNGMWKYYFRDHEVTEVVLAGDGSVHSISGSAWKVEFSSRREEDGLAYYSRIDMFLSDEERAEVRIRSVSINLDQWQQEQLALNIPPDAGIVYLTNY